MELMNEVYGLVQPLEMPIDEDGNPTAKVETYSISYVGDTKPPGRRLGYYVVKLGKTVIGEGFETLADALAACARHDFGLMAFLDGQGGEGRIVDPTFVEAGQSRKRAWLNRLRKRQDEIETMYSETGQSRDVEAEKSTTTGRPADLRH